MQMGEEQLLEESNTGRTFGCLSTSAILHGLLAFAVLTFNFAIDRIKAPPVTEIEILGPLPTEISESSRVSKLPVPSIKSEVSQSPLDSASDVIVKKTRAPKMKFKRAEVPKPAVAKKVVMPLKSKGAKPTPPMLTQPESEVDTALKTEDFEESLQAPIAVEAGKWNDKEVDKDLNKIERESKEQVDAVAAQLDRENQQMAAETEGKLASLKKEEQMRAEALAAAAAARQASIMASDKATAAGKGAGSGNPDGEEIRALSDLKQVPGNMRPQYDQEDRFRRRQGEIVFWAYINPQGMPVEFKFIRGTGHRTLDVKTLKALKTWRFYPGQEGWVEIPFKWDLVGGAQEMHGSLRREIGQK